MLLLLTGIRAWRWSWEYQRSCGMNRQQRSPRCTELWVTASVARLDERRPTSLVNCISTEVTKKHNSMEYIVHGSKIQNDNNLKLTLERVCWNDERPFDLLQQILITRRLSETWPRYMNRDQGYQLPPNYNQILPPVSGLSHRKPMRDQDL